MAPEDVWADPRTWISIGSLIVGFLGFSFGILSFHWNRKETRLDALSKILQPMVACAQQLFMANGLRKRCEVIRRSFPNPDAASDAAQHLKMHLDDYGKHIKESCEQFRLAESEFAARSFRFPDNVARLIDTAMKSLSEMGRLVNEGLFEKADLQLAKFRDDYGQITKVGRGWRLADPFEGIKKWFRKPAPEKPAHKYDISEKDMNAIMELVHKRATTQAQNTFAVHPPKKLIEHPEIAKSEKVIEELEDAIFVVAFQDGASRMMSLVELMVFVFNLIQLQFEAIEINRMMTSTDQIPQSVTVTFRMSIDEIMRPEMVRMLLEKITFSPDPSDDDAAESPGPHQ